MLEPAPLAILTPFTRSHIPRDEDVVRICLDTGEAYITSAVAPGPKRTRSQTVMKTIEGAIRYLRAAEPPTGHVCLRKLPGKPWTVSLDEHAVTLCQAS
jgi:hypothetical protein